MHVRSSLGAFRLGLLLALGLSASACSSEGSEDAGSLRPCSNSTPLTGQSGLELCDNGSIHRAQAAQCQSELPRSETCDPTISGGTASCSLDTDCTDRANGHCGVEGQILDCVCQYGCVKDSDCDTGQVCNCNSPVGYCATATCKTDADCGGGALCMQTRMTKCGAFSGYACQLRSDKCTTDLDCENGELCTLTDSGRTCFKNDCPVAGRPFLVEDEARVAALVARADWADDLTSTLLPVPASVREALSAHWSQIGQMEHASVAAFARFALQVLGLGAPAELVAEAQAAMADETRHARVCFGLATAYADRAVGPGPLRIDDTLAALSLEDVVRMTFREGCVGETAAAHEVRQCAEGAADPVLKALLSAIADDEARHALTAWKFVKWALHEFGGPVRAVIQQEVARLQSEPAAPHSTTDALAEHGVLGPSTRLALRAQAVRTVVVPCAQALSATYPYSNQANTGQRRAGPFLPI